MDYHKLNELIDWTLNSGKLVHVSNLPDRALTDVHVVASEVAQLALDVQESDMCIRTDILKSYTALNADNNSMSDWQEFLISGPMKFLSTALLDPPETGMIEFYNNKFYITNKSLQKAIDRTSDVKVTTTTILNDDEEKIVYTASVPIGSWVAGNVLKMFMAGGITNVGAVDDVTIRVRLGSITGDIIASLDSAGGKLTDACWHIHGFATVRDVGGTGHMAWHMDMNIDGEADSDACNVSEVDTTGVLDIIVTAEWDNAKAGNIFNCTMGWMEYKN